MSLHGHATFELTNVKTGEKQIIEEDNLITNALDALVKGSGVYGGTLQQSELGVGTWYEEAIPSGKSYRNIGPLKLTKGLVLFDKNLPEDPDYILPNAEDELSVTGIGMDMAYAGLALECGSYNESESGEIENGYRHVWDFNTSQANGQIGCACLTSPNGAAHGAGIGFPNSSGIASASPDVWARNALYPPLFDFVVPLRDDNLNGNDNWYAKATYIDEERSIVIMPKNYWSVWSNVTHKTGYVTNEPNEIGDIPSKNVFEKTFMFKKSIDIDIYRLPMRSVSMFDGFNYFPTEQKKYQGSSVGTFQKPTLELIETKTVEMPEDLKTLIDNAKAEGKQNSSPIYQWNYAFNYSKNCMNLIFSIPKASGYSLTIEKNETNIYVWQINLTDFTSKYYAIRNTTGVEIVRDNVNRNGYILGFQHAYVTDNQKLLISASFLNEGKIFLIDLEDNTNVVAIKDDGGNDVKIANSDTIFQHNGYVYIMSVHYFDNWNSALICINTKNGIARFLPSASCREFYWTNNNNNPIYVSGVTYGTKYPKFIRSEFWNGINTRRCKGLYISPDMLTTIDNLSSVVVKTAENTMKVTYTITNVDDTNTGADTGGNNDEQSPAS